MTNSAPLPIAGKPAGGDFSPSILLVEDRPKQIMVYQLNFSVYLDARVGLVSDIGALNAILDKPEKIDLIIVRAELKGKQIGPQIAKYLAEKSISIPLVSYGNGGKAGENFLHVPEENQVKPILQASARILGITAQQMAAKKKDEHYEISVSFLSLLFMVPADIFINKGSRYEKIFSQGDPISKKMVSKLVEAGKKVFIKSLLRLRFANALTEQTQKAAEDLKSNKVSAESKMSILSASVDIVAAQFQTSGMDEETAKLAESSILAIKTLAESSSDVGKLVKELLKAEGGYRYAHCQLITFLGFHIIKMMDWWGEDNRTIFSQATFYHDISLSTDEEAKIHSSEGLKALGVVDAEKVKLVLQHAQRAARELQNAPDMNPEVIRLVMQHHGSKTGQGFSNDISGLENLTKVFLVAEEWADYLISLSESSEGPQNEVKISQLKERFNDKLTHQIIETLRYLDAKNFSADFLVEEDLAVFTATPESTEEGASKTKVTGITEVRSDEAIKVGDISSAEEEERRISADAPVALVKTKVTGVTEVRNDEIIKVGDKNSPRNEEENSRIAADAQAATVKKKVMGVTEVRNDEIIEVGDKNSLKNKEEDTTITAGAQAKDQKTKIGGVTEVRKDELIKIGAENLTKEKMILLEGATEVIKDETIKIGAENLTKEKMILLEGATEVIKDETIVIKADPANPQSYVNKSLNTSADAKQATEIKMKALSGTTELMTSAVSGNIARVQEIMGAPSASVELKKTDAEGRTCFHYAAMGGSVPLLKFLLEKGAQKSIADSKRRSPLFFAALHKRNDAFDFLLAQGCRPNQQAMGGMTIAMVAAFSSNLHILKAAVAGGVRLETSDHNGKTALDYAKQVKAQDIIQFIESGGKA